MVTYQSRTTFKSRRWVKRVDWTLLFSTVLLIAAGLPAVRSATQSTAMQGLFVKQALWYTIGIIPLLIFAATNPQFWYQRAKLLYVVNLILLEIVNLKGHGAKGAQRWISLPGGFQFQPSEFAKLFTILTLGAFLSTRTKEIKDPQTLFITFLYAAVPAYLIYRQPDLSTALVIIAAWFAMTFMAGAKIKHLIFALLVGIIGFSAAWNFGLVKNFQKARMESFINPTNDPRSSGYQLTQSRIAIGSGQLLGKGYGQGTQKKGGFIPEQQTDFIFTVIGEEGGYVGAMLLLCGFMLFLWRTWLIIAHSSNNYTKLIATGAWMVFLFHVYINIGMTVGLAPVVGVPLPFISYGGSMALVAMSFVGLFLGIKAREERPQY